MLVHAHKYNTRLQAALRTKFFDLDDEVYEIMDYDTPETEPIEAMNTFIEYYTFLQHFQCWKNDLVRKDFKIHLQDEIRRQKQWYTIENGVPIHGYWSWKNTKESIQLWYTMDALEKMMEK